MNFGERGEIMKKRMSLSKALVAAGLFSTFGAVSWASSSGSKAMPDQHFITEAAQGGMAEVKLGQLASQKAVDADVRLFGQRMVDDHSKANDELKQLAQSEGAALPSGIGSKHQKTYDKLSKLSGSAFDKAYMQAMVKDHKEDVAAFQKQSHSAKDSDVRSWAAKTLPTLQMHLQMAQATAQKVGAMHGSGGSHKQATKM